MTTEHQLEVLSGALNSYQYAERAVVPAGLPRAEGRLLDAAVACGMDYQHDDLVSWAAERVALWLCAT